MSQTVFRIDSLGNSVHNPKPFNEQIPVPAKHEILIKVYSVSLNYRDIAVATSCFPFPVKYNDIPCSDAAGVVIEIGHDVRDIANGDLVVSTFDPTNIFGQQSDWLNAHGGRVDGVLREHVAIPAISAVKLPENPPQSFSEWSTLVCTGITAWNALYGLTPLKPGQIVLCQAAGATTIVTSSSDEKLDFVKSTFGVDYCVNYKEHPEWSKEVLRLTNGEVVDYVLESGGSGTIAESIDCVKMGGNVSVIAFLSRAKLMPDFTSLALSKAAIVRGITVGSTQLLQEVVRFVGRKGLRLLVGK
ncbi:hypothetical protein ZTR_00608 [Talaromyces verruculosus]|nr:hypothetical protein ZTR_00608 [Talaromyces verruculosus]